MNQNRVPGTVVGGHAGDGGIFLASALLFLVCLFPDCLPESWSRRAGPSTVLPLFFHFPHCCGVCECCWVPRSSWPGTRPLVSRYWLLSKGMWWTLWTCVFRFPFCEARYGQRWQQNGLSLVWELRKRWRERQNLCGVR